MSVSITSEGNFKSTTKFLDALKQRKYLSVLDKYGQMGVDALKEKTPKRTGKTAASWGYIVEKVKEGYRITWTNNSETDSRIPIVLLLIYGHGTATGGYVEGINFIDPALDPIFKGLADAAWKEVRRL